ncbi:integrase catalytic domain-containing protein [Trichonephila inaurata madagascariensis]|uniref:Integrase catalytic domain-containing protein n=1 Tax=Trichonephila inaurata madagascariensis TaxID=2747483 RepID=A0A8X6X4R5_9ARAC|nr:integrase catalytic domain-containing protein [Trichonephila inaurata madagascariensis]
MQCKDFILRYLLRAWERYVGYSSDESGKKDLDSLMKFLSIEVSSEDRIKLARNSFDSEKFNYKKKLGNLSTTATAADLFNSNFKNRKDFKFKNSNDNCIFCEKMHASENCCEAASISDVKCIICNKRHYAVLCSKLPLRSCLETGSASVQNSTTASSSSSNVLANQACTSEVLLQTLVVVLQNGNHRSLVRALIDTGSEKSYILKSTAENLGFKYEGEEFIHSLFGDSGHNFGGKIEILIGAVVAGKLLTGTMFYLKSGPVAIKTKLGWTLMGKTYRNVCDTKFDKNHFMNVTSMFVNDMCISDLWNLKDDCLSCKINCQKIEGKAITKRSLLSIANHIFDPIGFTAPMTLKPKLILQEIWKLKLKWDENIPENILNQVKLWLEQLPILAGIKIPRCLNLSFNGIKQITLHVFCDASKKAYAACVFLRVEYEENVIVKLIQAKARVAPLKDISIPRLELLSCTLGTRLAASVKNDLNLPDVRIYYLTDSMTALAWIQRTRD